MIKLRNSSVFFILLCFLCFWFFVSLFLVLLLKFFGLIESVTKTSDRLQFKSHLRRFQIKIGVPIRSRFTLHAIGIPRGIWRISSFVARQNIVSYWDFFSNISINRHKKFLPKTIWHGYWENLVKMSLLDQLVCFAVFVEMMLLADFFLLPLPNYFHRVSFPGFFVTFLKFLLPLRTFAISGAANSNK